MTLEELACELNDELKFSAEDLTRRNCFDEIRRKVSGASKMTNLQLLFQERVFIEFLGEEN